MEHNTVITRKTSSSNDKMETLLEKRIVIIICLDHPLEDLDYHSIRRTYDGTI